MTKKVLIILLAVVLIVTITHVSFCQNNPLFPFFPTFPYYSNRYQLSYRPYTKTHYYYFPPYLSQNFSFWSSQMDYYPFYYPSAFHFNIRSPHDFYYNQYMNSFLYLPSIFHPQVKPQKPHQPPKIVPIAIKVAPKNITFNHIGETEQLTVTLEYSNGNIDDKTSHTTGTTYISSDTSVATVSQDGLVTAISYGIVTITATNSQISDIAEVTVLIPPSIESFSPPPGAGLNHKQISVTGTLNQHNVQVTVNGQSATVTGRSFSAYNIPLTDGENTITITAQNTLGLEDKETFSVFVDSIPPTLSIISPPDGREVSFSRISVTGEVADAHLITTFLINNIPAQFYENRFDHLIPLSEGDNTITVYVQDEFGNETTESIRVAYTPATEDLAPPEISLSAPSDGDIFTSSPIQVIGRVVDDSPIKDLTMNGTPVSLEGLSFSALLSLSGGTNTITISATDAQDNASSYSITVFLDSTPPSGPQNLVITPSSTTNSDRVFLSGTAEPGTSIEVKGGAELFSTSVLESGDFNLTVFLKENTENRLSICVIDQGGHRSIDQIITVVQDTGAPQIMITSPSDGAVLPTESLTVTGTVKDKSPIASVSVNGQAASLIPDSRFSQSITLTEGENSITINATDAANNVGTASIQVTVRITPEGEPDNDPPIITIISPLEGSYHNKSPIQIRGSIMDASAISHIHINGVPLDPGIALSGDIFTGNVYLEDNAETVITIEATDEHGNNAQITIAVLHDTDPPIPPTLEDTPEETNLSQISIRGQAEPLSTLTITGGNQTAAALADEKGAFGQVIGLNLNVANNLSATCTDRAGNESEPSFLLIRQDSTPPQVSTVSPENGQKGIELDTTIYIKFNETIDCATVPGNVFLLANGSVLSSAFECVDAGTSLLFQDDQVIELPPGTQFELRINTSLTDVAGNGLSAQYRSFFYTKDTHAPDPPVVTSDLPEATRYRQIKIIGKTEANATVIITGGASAIEAPADEKGIFSAQVALSANAANNLSLVARDVSGQQFWMKLF